MWGGLQALAGLLDYFAGQLRGERPDLDGPPLTAFLAPSLVRQALARLDSARLRAEGEWGRLGGEDRKGACPPDELLGIG